MKKYVFVLMLAVGVLGMGVPSAMAQDDFSFAVKGGLNFSALGGDSRYDYASKVGFHVGALAEIPFTDIITLQPEALLSYQGSGALYNTDIRLWYLNIPLMAKYNVWDDLWVEAGPYLGLLLSSDVDDFYQGPYDYDPDPDTNTIDIGASFGAGYRFTDELYFQLRFSPGFINVIKDYSSKNRVVQLSVAYFF